MKKLFKLLVLAAILLTTPLTPANAQIDSPAGVSGGVIKAIGQTSNFVITLPANTYITAIFINETLGNAITGGIKIGTTGGATDVVVALAVGASSIQIVPMASILKLSFSTTSSQQLFFQTVTLWNGASVNVEVIYQNL